MKRKYIISTLLLSFLILLISCNKSTDKKPIDLKNIKVVIITYTSHDVLNAVVDGIVEGLISKYHIARQNVEVFNPNRKLDEVQSFVRQLNSLTTDLIIPVSTPTSQAVLSSRHPNIPILYSFVSDTSALNTFGQNNYSGISNVLNYEKGFQLLNNIIPDLKSLAVLYNPTEANSIYSFNQIRKEAAKHDPPINIISRQFSKAEEIQSAVSTLKPVDAIYVGGDNLLVGNISLLLSIAKIKRIPVFASDEGSVRAGAIAAYSIDYKNFGEKTADIAYQILMQKNANGIPIFLYDQGRCVKNSSSLEFYHLNTSKLDSSTNCINVGLN